MPIEHPERLERIFIPGIIGGSPQSVALDEEDVYIPHATQNSNGHLIHYTHWSQLINDNTPVEPRSPDDVSTWDETFMAIAAIWAKRSKDPNTQVGAVIVKNNQILSSGYNGPAHGLDNDKVSWNRSGNPRLTKYASVIHAEQNAIYNILGLGITVYGASIYTTLFPCHECAKAIAQCGIKEVVFMGIAHDGDDVSDDTATAIDRFVDSGVAMRQFVPQRHLQDGMIII